MDDLQKNGFSFTPKEGAGRSNRLGDANKNKGLQCFTVSPCYFKLHIGCNKEKSFLLITYQNLLSVNESKQYGVLRN